MNVRARSTAGATLLALLLAATFPTFAGAAIFGKKKVQQDTMPGRKLTPAQNALIDKAIVQEKQVIKVVKERAPLVETYKQNKGNFGGKQGKLSFFKNSFGALGSISSSLRLTFHESGFVQMILMDSNDFDRQHYNFSFVRNDFLGNIPTAVFDVSPSSGKREFGRFFGRIWVETRDGNVVRFNGDFAGSIETIK